ncbi:ROK family transcriptional regulator [Brevibacillus fulvus]|uniref:ROK family transcriptional regulator n=1 Tax=Brevibacillus fulvus TaxID=1125967 RepID=UPI00195CD2FC
MLEKTRTGSSKLLKWINKAEILSQLKEHGQISRAELSKRTKLSRPCVSSLVEEMIEAGLICEVGIGHSTGGRRPILLECNYQAYAIVGAIFDGSLLQMALTDLRGEVLADCETRLLSPFNGDEALQKLAAGLQILIEKSGYPRQRLLGIGVGLPGITQRREGTISFSPSTGWTGLPVKQEIERKLGIPALIDNDVNLMALGEYVEGVGTGSATMVYLYVGTGIGSGIMIDGQLYRGGSEAAGEVGFMMIGPNSGNKLTGAGVFEQNYSTAAILARAKGLLSGLDEGSSIIQQLIAYANQGNTAAKQLLDDTYRHWAYGLANIVSVLNPDLLVLSGEMIHIDDKGVKQISELLEQSIPVMPRVKKAALGNRAGMVGAVHSVLEAFFSAKLMKE